MAAPAKPPINVWEDEEGMPSHQVNKFQRMAAIRPEKITISRDKPDVADNWASAVVRDIAYMGDMSIYLLRLDSGKVVRVTQPNIYRHAEDRITWEERVYLQWYPESPVVVTK